MQRCSHIDPKRKTKNMHYYWEGGSGTKDGTLARQSSFFETLKKNDAADSNCPESISLKIDKHVIAKPKTLYHMGHQALSDIKPEPAKWEVFVGEGSTNEDSTWQTCPCNKTVDVVTV